MPKNDKKCGFWSLFGHASGGGKKRSVRKGKSRNYLWLHLAFLLFFLLGGGFYAFFNMGNVAHELVGGKNYQNENTQSRGYGSVSSSNKVNGFSVFSGDSEIKGDVKKGKSPNFLKNLKKKELKAVSPGSANEQDGDFNGKSGRNTVAKKTLFKNNSLPHKLSRKFSLKKGGKFLKAGKKKGGKSIIFSKRTDKSFVAVNRRDKTSIKTGGMLEKGKVSALKGLKSSWRTNIYGVRDASQDSARNWIAKTFDNTIDAKSSLEYSEKVKRHLDRIDPNSIPQYLRNQDISASSAESLGIKDVSSPKLDSDVDSSYEAAQGMTQGLLNPIFSGINFAGGETAQSEDFGNGPSILEAPMSDPKEEPRFDNPSPFEVKSFGCGEECGCSCDAPCCCLPPGYFNNTGDFPPAI